MDHLRWLIRLTSPTILCVNREHSQQTFIYLFIYFFLSDTKSIISVWSQTCWVRQVNLNSLLPELLLKKMCLKEGVFTFQNEFNTAGANLYLLTHDTAFISSPGHFHIMSLEQKTIKKGYQLFLTDTWHMILDMINNVYRSITHQIKPWRAVQHNHHYGTFNQD